MNFVSVVELIEMFYISPHIFMKKRGVCPKNREHSDTSKQKKNERKLLLLLLSYFYILFW